MNDPAASAYDYEEIVKLLNRRDADSEKVENKKNILHGKQWAALKRYSEAIEKFESAENINNTLKNLISDKTRLRTNIDQEHEVLTRELEKLQQMYDEIKTKSEAKSKEFYKNVEELCQEFIRVPFEFDSENMHQMIKDYTKSVNFFRQEIASAMQEKRKLKDIIKNFDNLQDDLSDAKEVTKIIQRESLEKYGNPMELQIHLSKLHQNNEALIKEMQDIKVKYGI